MRSIGSFASDTSSEQRMCAEPAAFTAPAPVELNSRDARAKRQDIQILRGLAVALVVAAHAGVPALAGGYVGVDVFFVVSGYVITGALLRDHDTSMAARLGRFYRNRIMRLVPAATLALIATLLASAWLLGPQSDARLPADVRWASLFGANFNLINGRVDYFMAGVDPSVVIHFWSLGVEEQFYLAYPLMLLVPLALLPNRRGKSSAFGLLLVAVAASAVWSAVSTRSDPVVAYYSPLTRFWELGVGGWIALLPAVGLSQTMRRTLSSLGVVMIIGAALSFDAGSQLPGWVAWLPCGATALALYAGEAEQMRSTRSARRFLAGLGDMSYSVYLWHFLWLLLPLQFIAVVRPQLALNEQVSGLISIGGVGGALVTGWLSYRFMETPLRRNRLIRDDGLSATLLLMCCVLAVWTVSYHVQAQMFSP